MSICDTFYMYFLDWIGKSPPRPPQPRHSPTAPRISIPLQLKIVCVAKVKCFRGASHTIVVSNRMESVASPPAPPPSTACPFSDSQSLCRCHWCFAAHSSVFSLVMEFINISLCPPVKEPSQARLWVSVRVFVAASKECQQLPALGMLEPPCALSHTPTQQFLPKYEVKKKETFPHWLSTFWGFHYEIVKFLSTDEFALECLGYTFSEMYSFMGDMCF